MTEKPYIQGGDEHVIISADRPVEYGVLDGDTIKVRPYDIAASNARENDYWSQVHFPQLWRCARCGITKDDPRARQACAALGGAYHHDWRRK